MSDLQIQLRSCYFPQGNTQSPTLIAQIYFPTDVDQLDQDDAYVLDRLILDFKLKLYAYKRLVNLSVVGHADYRGTEQYNDGLSERRATAVKRYLDRSLNKYRRYKSSLDSKGEQQARQTDLAADRRVDIYSSVRSRMRIPAIEITGKPPGEYSNEFDVRTWIGAGVALGPLAAQVLTIEIRNPNTRESVVYTYSGTGVGFSVNISVPSQWTRVPVGEWLKVGDFEGPGWVRTYGAVLVHTDLVFKGPVNKGRTSEPVKITLEGLDGVVGGSQDADGWWRRR